MASGTEEDLEESGCAATDGGTSQLPQAGLEKAAECSWCPIYLGDIKDTAYAAFCLRRFCFASIEDGTKRRARCLLCRQPFDLLLHSVQVNNSYTEYMVPLSNCLRRDVVRERVQSRSPQWHNNLHSSVSHSNFSGQ